MPSPEQRFWARVNRDAHSGCWEWQGRLNEGGYGRIFVSSRVERVHRFAYELLVGPIPDGLTIDHLCFNRRCVNPEHLEPVSRGENAMRGSGPLANQGRQTHCKRGHAFTAENSRIEVRSGFMSRVCRVCRREREQERRAADPEFRARRNEDLRRSYRRRKAIENNPARAAEPVRAARREPEKGA